MTAITPRFGSLEACSLPSDVKNYLIENTSNGPLGVYQKGSGPIMVASGSNLNYELNIRAKGEDSLESPFIYLNPSATQEQIKKVVDFYA